MPLLDVDIGEELGRLAVLRVKIERRSGADGKQVVHQRGAAPGGEVEVGISDFKREGVFGQPDLERLIEREAQLEILRRMDVQIDHAGQIIGAGGQAQ